MNQINNNSKTIGNFDKNVYDYIISEQTSRWKWTILTFITIGIMIANEFQYFNSCFSFTVLGCKNITSGYNYSKPYAPNSIFSTVDQSEYSIETCIDSRVQYCIPIIYTSPDNLNASLSFSITKESIAYQLYNTPNFRADYSSIYYGAGIVFCLLNFFYLVIVRIQYVLRSRAHLLLSLNVILVPSKKMKILFWFCIIFYLFLSISYSLAKYLTIIQLNNDASVIFCDSNVMELYFDGKTTSSLFQIILNFAVFVFIFKDMVLNINDGRSFYDEIKFISFIKSKNSLNSMDRLKELKSITDNDFLFAVYEHVDEEYPIGSISTIKRIALTRLSFISFFLKKADIIPIIQKYYKRYPNNFISFIETNDGQNQDVQSITITENTNLIN